MIKLRGKEYEVKEVVGKGGLTLSYIDDVKNTDVAFKTYIDAETKIKVFKEEAADFVTKLLAEK